MRRTIKIFDVILSLICSVVMLLVALGSYALPNEYISYDNNDLELGSIYSCNANARTRSVDYQLAYPTTRTVRLLGAVPVKDVVVTKREQKTVFVSGEVFGIKLYTDGVIVVGTQEVDDGNQCVNPSHSAGIEIGDIIVSINGKNVFSSDDVEEILNDNNGQPYRIKIIRDGRYRTFDLTPVFSPREDCYKAGMWVRDSTAGIGTITFYDKNNGMFGALGHQINDVDTNEIMPMLEGEAVSASVTSVQKARSGATGSLVCKFGEQTLGTLVDNGVCGIFGAYSGVSDCAKEYPVAPKQEVTRGSAKIISTIDSTGPQEFDVEISHIYLSSKGEGQNMVIRITDERLLSATGGIVQGMSGSPIIQNGKLVGALTHVIINNPHKGYAIFAESMVEHCK